MNMGGSFLKKQKGQNPLNVFLLTAVGPVSAARVVAPVGGDAAAVGGGAADVGRSRGDSVGSGAVNDRTGETVDEVAQGSLE